MALNLALRFILEVCALVSFSYWGFQSDKSFPIKLVLGIGTPLLIALIWGIFGSPSARIPLRGFARILLELFIFGLAAIALYASGKPILAMIFAFLVLINRIIMYIWDQ
ncbi:YrdB family protein [Anoxybacteroides tepidamans]|uniref:YrdB family protein n=1 Tax=Anoxybacteroides tepidamans TaxID=265948 RepID=UPI000554F3C9|nr:YrdB family protein [Anoxybacillus tepidamans]